MSWQATQQQLNQHQHHQQQHQHQQQQQPQQDLASHFHLLPLIETAADALERGAMDQHVNELVNDLAFRFDRCQQLLNNITITSNSKPITVRWQKQKLEEHENQLNLRSELMLKYKTMVEQAVNPDQ
ncbi:hypothetical protein R1flu_006731 [Riccia fluitans]|uniref:Mediator complex subunit 9 n=1 Tax=Riccia fluitans TaxID=41844 RepID=A0ABD1YWU5_9MARC